MSYLRQREIHNAKVRRIMGETNLDKMKRERMSGVVSNEVSEVFHQDTGSDQKSEREEVLVVRNRNTMES